MAILTFLDNVLVMKNSRVIEVILRSFQSSQNDEKSSNTNSNYNYIVILEKNFVKLMSCKIRLELEFFINIFESTLLMKGKIFKFVNVMADIMAILRILRWQSLRIFFNVLVMEMCLKSFFQNVNVPAATMGILTDFRQCSGHW